MTDAPLSPDDDELVSAYLDGEATVEERALVEGNPRLLARVDKLRRTAESLRSSSPPAAPSGGLEALLAAAAVVADEALPVVTDVKAEPAPPSPSSSGPSPAAGPDGLASATLADVIKLERKRPPKMLAILSAAAAFVVVLGVLGGVLQASRTSTKSDTATFAAAPFSVPTSPAPAAAGPAGGSAKAVGGNDSVTSDLSTGAPLSTTTTPSFESTVSSPPAPPANTPTTTGRATGGSGGELAATYRGDDLGPLLSGADVRAAVANRRSAAPPPTAPPTTLPGGAGAPNSDGSTAINAEVAARLTACDVAVRGTDRELGGAVYGATGTFAGAPALVMLYAIAADIGNANGVNRLYTVHRDTCAVLNTQTY